METITSTSSMDRPSRIMTIVLTLVLVGTLLLISSQRMAMWGTFALFSIIYGVVYGFLPTMLRITSDTLVLDAPLKKIRLSLSDIQTVRLLGPQDKKGLFRTCGSSGIFGEWGYFYSSALKTVKVYARRTDNWILVTTYDHGSYVIAPDDPDFICYLEKAIR